MNFAGTAAAVIERIRAAADLNAVLAWSPEAIEAEAIRAAALDGGALAGMPIAVKDNLVTVGYPTTCASRMLEGYRSPFDATAVRRLRDAGALIVAKTNLDEFAMGASTEHSAYGRVRHPMAPDRVAGGSSGGSAALVAAGVVPAALGSETGGSVRQPAAFCGCVGVKPSYGRVSRYGLVAFASSLDCVAVFGQTVRDAARVLSVISGADPRDATCRDLPPLEVPAPRPDLRGLRVGLPVEYLPESLHRGVSRAVDRAVEACRGLGAEVVPVSLPHTGVAVPTYYVIAPAEAAANLARYDGVRFGQRRRGADGDLASLYRATRGRGFGPEVRRRILIGTYVLSSGYYEAYYGRALRARQRIAADFDRVFGSGIDLLLTPTTPEPAFLAGAKTDDPIEMYRADAFVCPVSLAGLPALSLPAGTTDGLPVGIQLIGPELAEPTLLAAAEVLERALDPKGALG